MLLHELAIACGVVGMVAALAAAGTLFAAASKPVAVQTGSFYDVGPNTPGLREHNEKILSGARLNRCGAGLAVVSALVGCLPNTD